MASFLSPLLGTANRDCSLTNARSDERLASHIEAAFDSTTRNRGLLGRNHFEKGTALILAPCTAVHTWFMRFPIDVLFVSKGGMIRKVRTAVQPWRLAIAWRAYAVIELPAGAAGDCRPGDMVEVVPNGDPGSQS